MPNTPTPNMGLVPPTVQGDKNTWGTEINSDLSLVDAHDHTTGKGVKVPTAGLNINADLNFNTYSPYNIDHISLVNKVANPNGACIIYFKNNELWFRDGNATAKRVDLGTILGVSNSANNLKITSLATPTVGTDAANKQYVDDKVATVDTLSEILANGNTTGAHNILFSDGLNYLGFGSDLPGDGYIRVGSTWNVVSRSGESDVNIISIDAGEVVVGDSLIIPPSDNISMFRSLDMHTRDLLNVSSLYANPVDDFSITYASTVSGSAHGINLVAQTSSAANGNGGSISILAGNGIGSGTGGNITLQPGTGSGQARIILNGKVDMQSNVIDNLPAPGGANQPATKSYVDTNAINKAGTVAFTADQSMGTHKLTSLATPTVSTDAATKGYVDGYIPSFLTSAGWAFLSLSAQTSSIGSTVITTPAASGVYQVSVYLGTGTPGTSGNVTASIIVDDVAGSNATFTTSTLNFGAAGRVQSTYTIAMGGGNSIKYSTTVTSPVGSPTYLLRVVVNRIA